MNINLTDGALICDFDEEDIVKVENIEININEKTQFLEKENIKTFKQNKKTGKISLINKIKANEEKNKFIQIKKNLLKQKKKKNFIKSKNSLQTLKNHLKQNFNFFAGLITGNLLISFFIIFFNSNENFKNLASYILKLFQITHILYIITISLGSHELVNSKFLYKRNSQKVNCVDLNAFKNYYRRVLFFFICLVFSYLFFVLNYRYVFIFSENFIKSDFITNYDYDISIFKILFYIMTFLCIIGWVAVSCFKKP